MTSLATILQSDWGAAGHESTGVLLDAAGRWAPWVLCAILVVLLVRAGVRRERYRALTVLGEAEQARLHQAVTAAERRTIGEVLPVVLERSDRHPGADWCAALSFLIVGTGAFAAYLPWTHPLRVIALQVALAGLGFALARWLPDFKRLFISQARAEELAAEQAVQEFHRARLWSTEGATGVLLFVSLLEHRVIVLGDVGITAKVEPELWGQVDEAVLAGIRAGSLCDGLVDAIGRCGDVLAEHFPWAEGDRNEVPDRVIVRRE